MNVIVKLFSILHSNASPGQITAGFTLGVLLGFSPMLSLQAVVLLFLLCCFRINIPAFSLAWVISCIIALPLQGIAINIGEQLLSQPSIQPLWQAMYDITLLRLTFFNHTKVLGELVFAILCLPVLAPACYFIVTNYRNHIYQWLSRQPIVSALKAMRLFQLFNQSRG